MDSHPDVGFAVGYIFDAVLVHWEGQSERKNLPVEVWKKKFGGGIDFLSEALFKKSYPGYRTSESCPGILEDFNLEPNAPFFWG